MLLPLVLSPFVVSCFLRAVPDSSFAREVVFLGDDPFQLSFNVQILFPTYKTERWWLTTKISKKKKYNQIRPVLRFLFSKEQGADWI